MEFCKKFKLLVLFFSAFFIVGCGEEIGHITSIRIFPASTTVSIGSTALFTALAYDSDGKSAPISPTWTVSENIGTINSAGIFNASNEGLGSVSAYYAGVFAYAQVNVTNQGNISGRVTNSKAERLSGIQVSLDSPSIDTITSSNGTYLFASLDPGKYTVTAHGNAKYLPSSQDVSLNTGGAATANFSLIDRIGVMSESISQSGQSITINGSLVNNGSTPASSCTVNYIFYNLEGFSIGSGNASAGNLDPQESRVYAVFITLSEDSYANYSRITACGSY
jgi:hypothetical protein